MPVTPIGSLQWNCDGRRVAPAGVILSAPPRLALLGFLLAPAAAPAQEPYSGFTFCVAPTPPACIDAARSSREKKACEERVRSYVSTVFAYRACLDAETQRAVLQSNDALERWRCRQSGGPSCRVGAKRKEAE